MQSLTEFEYKPDPALSEERIAVFKQALSAWTDGYAERVAELTHKYTPQTVAQPVGEQLKAERRLSLDCEADLKEVVVMALKMFHAIHARRLQLESSMGYRDFIPSGGEISQAWDNVLTSLTRRIEQEQTK